MGVILDKIISITQDLNDVEYGLVTLRELYENTGTIIDDKTDDLIKTSMSYLTSAESVLQEMEQREEANL